MNSDSAVKILVIYTGGTIGMQAQTSGSLAVAPLNFQKEFPFIEELEFNVSFLSIKEIKDSSDISAEDWLHLAALIRGKSSDYTAFVVLHGTDTMSYAASAQSFLLQELKKAVIFTGAQIPISESDSDGEDNFKGALEFAAAFSKEDLKQTVVGIYFDGSLLQANRTVKYSSYDLAAFQSPNYEELGIRSNGIQLFDNHQYISLYLPQKISFSNKILVLKIHPFMDEQAWVKIIEEGEFDGILIESFGSGNIPKFVSLLECIEQEIKKGTLVLNVSQCVQGEVNMHQYAVGEDLARIGVLSGGDITFEAAIVKLMLCSSLEDKKLATSFLNSSIAGEMTLTSGK